MEHNLSDTNFFWYGKNWKNFIKNRTACYDCSVDPGTVQYCG